MDPAWHSCKHTQTWLIDWLFVGWLVGRLVGWLLVIGWLVVGYWLVGWLYGGKWRGYHGVEEAGKHGREGWSIGVKNCPDGS